MRWSDFVYGYGNATQEEVREAIIEGQIKQGQRIMAELDEDEPAQTYTVTITRAQIIINWGDERRFYQRNEKGRAAVERCKARLRAQGIYEADD